MILSKLFVEFVIYSFMGWIYECAYCTLKTGHWQNRGFLFGPICPIYGAGGMSCILFFGPGGIVSNINRMAGLGGGEIPTWEIFTISAVGSFILEYLTSYLLEKIFHAVWWDYSETPLNINGRACLPATLGFGVAGVFVSQYLLPAARSVKDAVPPLVAEFLSLLVMAYVAADLVLTISSLTQLLEKVEAAEQTFNEKAEDTYQRAANLAGALTYRQRYLLGNLARMSSQKGTEAVNRLKEAVIKRLPERNQPPAG